MDMSEVIIPKSDQINADDLISGPRTITIREVVIKGGQEQPVSIYFDGSDKAFRPCKSMSRVLVKLWGADAKAYVGRSITLFRDPKVKWGGLEVGGIRISHASGLDAPATMTLTATKGVIKPFMVKPLAAPSSAPQARVAGGGRADAAPAKSMAMHVREASDALAAAAEKGMDEVEARWTGDRMTKLRAALDDEQHASLFMDLTGAYTAAKSAAEAPVRDALPELEGSY